MRSAGERLLIARDKYAGQIATFRKLSGALSATVQLEGTNELVTIRRTSLGVKVEEVHGADSTSETASKNIANTSLLLSVVINSITIRFLLFNGIICGAGGFCNSHIRFFLWDNASTRQPLS